jgi:DNA-binding Lrp family transcriptional regulator
VSYLELTDERIISTLEAFGRLSTREIAMKIGASREGVYRRCKKLERDGRLKSELVRVGIKTVYFFPMTREVLTGTSQAEIMRLNDAVLEIIRAHSLPRERAQLIISLEVGLERLAETVTESKRGFFLEFAEQLIATAAKAERRGDLTSELGIRPMRPPIRLWMLGPQLGLL